jgi:TRAP-type C4-dicarboxylate transport system permease small subunit
MLDSAIRLLDRALQVVTIGLIVVLACVVLLGVGFRYTGNSLIWYDELASVLLAWITFLGAAFATLRNAHLGFGGLLYGLPPAGRAVLFWIVEMLFIGAFLIVVWAGWTLLELFGNETMTSLRFVPRWLVQGVLPAAALLMVAARLMTLPARRAAVRLGRDPESEEIAHEIARAEAEAARGAGEGTRRP